MPRRRLIDEAVLSSPDLMPLPASGRYLWIGLLIIADLDGYVRNDLRYIRNRIFPQTKTRLTWLKKCMEYFEARGMIEIRPDRGSKRGRVGSLLGSSGGRVGSEWGMSGGSIGVELGVSGGRVGAELGASAVVSYVYIKNWSRYQKHRSARSDRSGVEGSGVDTETPTHGGPGDENSEPSDQGGNGPPTLPPDCEALQFLVEELALKPERLPEARESILRRCHTPDDVEDWRECLTQARAILASEDDPRKRNLPGDPVSFLRSRMLKHKNPRETIISWWRPGKRQATEKEALIRALRAREGQTVKLNGTTWEVTTIGLQGPDGIRQWGDVTVDDLRELVNH